MRLLAVALCILVIPIAGLTEEIRASLAVSATNSIFNKIKDPFEKATGIKLVYISKDPKGHGAVECFRDVDDGVADIGVAGMSQFDWAAHAQKSGHKIKNPTDIKYASIGRDLVYIFVHKSGPSSFTDAQLTDIVSGKMKNFSEMGGANQEIVVIEHAKLEATKKTVLRKFKVENLGAKTILIKDPQTTADMIQKIGATPGAIGWGVKDAADDTVKVAVHEPIGRPIMMIYRGDRMPEKIKKLTDFITKEGKKFAID